MQGGKENQGSWQGDFLNAAFQGFFNRKQTEQEQVLEGVGVVMDDELNWFLSDWSQGQLQGPSLVRFSSGMIVYGGFKENVPAGVVAVQFGTFRLFLCRLQAKDQKDEKGTGGKWKKEAALIDNEAKVFYVLELSLKEQYNSGDTAYTQSLSRSSYAKDTLKPQWKIKIVDRYNLKSNGSLLSKLSKKYQKHHQKDNSGAYLNQASPNNQNNFTVEERNHFSLISTVLGDSFNFKGCMSLITPAAFMREMSQNNQRIIVKETGGNKEETLFLSVGYGKVKTRRSKGNANLLGLVYSETYAEVRSVGNHTSQGISQGLGLQITRKGDFFLGTFKQNLLVKEYSTTGSTAGPFSIPAKLRQVLSEQHLRSVNYIHNGHYVFELQELVSLGKKVVGYTVAFQNQFRKRHFSYCDTEGFNQSSLEGVNYMKYQDEEDSLGKKDKIVEKEEKDMEKDKEKDKDKDKEKNKEKDKEKQKEKEDNLDTLRTPFKKPGFIINKQNSSRSPVNAPPRSPVKPKTKSPAKELTKSPVKPLWKSPAKQAMDCSRSPRSPTPSARTAGKIFSRSSPFKPASSSSPQNKVSISPSNSKTHYHIKQNPFPRRGGGG